jgi:GMP reductase
MKFDFDDILLTPEIFSTINSRKEVNIFDEHGMLPIMTAPMDTVVDEDNYTKFIDNKINVVLPRFNKYNYSGNKLLFRSYGLDEFKSLFLDASPETDLNVYALIDVANGHMSRVLQYVQQSKAKYGDKLVLMVGNVANPKTYLYLSKNGADYVRCGIGGGAGCLTSVQTGVGYPMASLIKECFEYKVENNCSTKIVADGGFKKFADINKALALGADYVMLGSMLNKAYESCSPIYELNMGVYHRYRQEDDVQLTKELLKFGKLYKSYRGMSTKEVQKSWGRTELKTSEGISTFNKIEYTLEGFVENLSDYLRSAMSYLNASNLKEFKEARFELITHSAFKRFDK